MPAELRKRKEAPPAPVRPAKKKAPAKGKKSETEKTVVEQVQEAVTETVEAVKEAVVDATNGASAKLAAATTGAVKVGDTIDLTSFGGEIETNDGKKTTLAKLVEESKGGVVLFTYPKASTPGCTTQVCLFRDGYTSLTATGFSIYGLSSDSTKANTTFKTKQKLQYPLLCDPAQTLISAIGLKKAPKSTTRGVFVVDKAGKVLAAQSGGPAVTVDVVKKLVDSGSAASQEDVEAAKTAAEVADTAAKVDAK